MISGPEDTRHVLGTYAIRLEATSADGRQVVTARPTLEATGASWPDHP